MNKINSYIGFAIKSRKVVYGADNILSSKNCKLIVASTDLAQNTIDKLKTKNIQIVMVDHSEFQTLNLRGLVVGITDENLSNAIKNNIAQ